MGEIREDECRVVPFAFVSSDFDELLDALPRKPLPSQEQQQQLQLPDVIGESPVVGPVASRTEPVSPVLVPAATAPAVVVVDDSPQKMAPTPPRPKHHYHQHHVRKGGHVASSASAARCDKRRSSRLPDAAVDALKKWLVDKLDNPYPSKDEKTDLARTTGLSVAQVNNWFINARRRFVKPLIAARDATRDHSSGSGPLLKARTTSRAAAFSDDDGDEEEEEEEDDEEQDDDEEDGEFGLTE
jgi:hypothetical protein